MKKKILLSTLALLLAISLVAIGCAAPAPAPAPPPEPKVEPMVWKVNCADAVGHSVYDEWWEPWAKELEEKTDGIVKPELYPGQALGYKGSEQLIMVQAGILDCSEILIGWNTGHYPDIGVFDLPLLFTSAKECTEGLQATWDILLKELPKRFGAHPIMYYAHDEQVIVSSKRLTSLDELKGLKIRVFAPLQEAILKEVGATGVYVAFGEQYSALQRGVVDAAITGARSHLALRHYEVADYVWYGTGLAGFAASMVCVSDKQWSKLPDDVKQTVLDIGEKYSALSLQLGDRWLDESLVKLEENGMTVTKVTAEDLAQFRAISEAVVWPDWSSEHSGDLGRVLLAVILEAQGK